MTEISNRIKIMNLKKENAKLWNIILVQLIVFSIVGFLALSFPFAYKDIREDLNSIKSHLNTIQHGQSAETMEILVPEREDYKNRFND